MTAAGGAITITLPLPARELSPNARVDRRVRARAVSEARFEAAMLIRAQLAAQGIVASSWPISEATVEIVYPNHIRRDTSNTFASLKAAWDAMTDCDIWRDDQYVIWHLPLPRVDKQAPGVRITIEQGGG